MVSAAVQRVRSWFPEMELPAALGQPADNLGSDGAASANRATGPAKTGRDCTPNLDLGPAGLLWTGRIRIEITYLTVKLTLPETCTWCVWF